MTRRPPVLPARWPRPRPQTRVLLWIALLCAGFSATMLLTYHSELDDDVEVLRAALIPHA